MGIPAYENIVMDKVIAEIGFDLARAAKSATYFTRVCRNADLNATARTCDEIIKRAVFARELGVPIVMLDYLIGGFTANTSLAYYCRDNSLLLHILLFIREKMEFSS